MLPDLRALSYKERLGLFSLEFRRLKDGLVDVFKIMRGIDTVNSKGLFPWVIALLAPKVEYEVLLLQFAGSVIVALEEAQDGHVTKGLGGGVKMVGNQMVL
eukprot:g34445.t1